MLNFYLIILGASGIYLTVQLAAYLFYDKVFFRSTGILFEEKKNRIEWQTVFPKNLLMLIIVLFAAAFFGLLMTAAGIEGWISMPLAAAGGLAVNFTINAAIIPFADKRSGSGLPTDELLDGMSAVVLTDITEEDYGKIELRCGGRSYVLDAMSANGRTLSEGERVVVIHAQDRLCFVEAEDRLYDVLFDETEQDTEQQTEQENE